MNITIPSNIARMLANDCGSTLSVYFDGNGKAVATIPQVVGFIAVEKIVDLDPDIVGDEACVAECVAAMNRAMFKLNAIIGG